MTGSIQRYYFFKDRTLDPAENLGTEDLLTKFELKPLYDKFVKDNTSPPPHFDTLVGDVIGKVDCIPDKSIRELLASPPPLDQKIPILDSKTLQLFKLSPADADFDKSVYGFEPIEEEIIVVDPPRSKFIIKLDPKSIPKPEKSSEKKSDKKRKRMNDDDEPKKKK